MATKEDGRLRKLTLFKPYLLEFVSTLDQMRTQDTLTDITVSVCKRHFRAHKVVLAACSHYFMAMFTSGFQESSQKDVTIEEGTAEVMAQLLDFAYSGMLTLNQDTIIDVLTMASYLQMRSAIDACTQYLREQMVESEEANITWGEGVIFQVYLVAARHQMIELKDLSWQLIVNNFVILSRTLGFQKYVTTELLVELLGRSDIIKPDYHKIPHHLQISGMLCVLPAEAVAELMGGSTITKYSEEQVLKAVVSWLNYNWEARKQYAPSLLKKVRLGVIPATNLTRLFEMTEFQHLSECKALLAEVLMTVDPGGATPNSGLSIAVQKQDMFYSRGTITALLATGGTRTGNVGPFAQHFFYDNPEIEEINWIPMLNFRKPSDVTNINDHTMAVLGDRLYIAGGTGHDENLPPNVLKSFFIYDTFENDWQRLPDMFCGRAGFVLVLLDNLIYAIGGWDEHGNLSLLTDTYNTTDQTWGIGSRHSDCCDPCAIVHHGKILMYGHGINDGLPSDNHVYYYVDDEDGNGGEYDMFTANLMDEQREVRTSLHTLQVYDPGSKKWYPLMRQRHCVHTAHGENEQYSALMVKNDKVYLVVYDKVRDRHCWVSKPRVNELVLDLESGALSAKLGLEETQLWLPEYHVPGAFCIDREIYVNVNGCIINTGQMMPTERPLQDKISFSKWLGVDVPEIANAAVVKFTFDHYNLTM